MKKMLFLSAILLFMGFGLGAQIDDCIVFGQVTDAGSGQGLVGVSITCVENSKIFELTDDSGEFYIVIPRNSSLRAEYQGYHVSDGQSQTGPYSDDASEWSFSMSSN